MGATVSVECTKILNLYASTEGTTRKSMYCSGTKQSTKLRYEIAASFDNDAKGCYDKIVPPQAMINCRRL